MLIQKHWRECVVCTDDDSEYDVDDLDDRGGPDSNENEEESEKKCGRKS